MAIFRFRKVFHKDVSSSLVPKDLSKYARIGVIRDVNVEQGLCTVHWYDKPSSRQDVIITQGSPGGFTMPKVGTVVVVVFDAHDRAFIASYITLGHEERVKTLKTLPKLKPEEKYWEVGGSYIYMRQNGDIILSTLTEGHLILENATGSLKQEFVNWRLVTEAGIQYFGLVKRLKLNADGTKSLEIIEDPLTNQNIVEYDIKIMEKADGMLGLSPNAVPIMQITLGNVINEDGLYVDKLDGTEIPYSNENKQLCARVKLKSGIQIDIDKEGRVTINNLKLNINEGSVDTNDPDISLGLEVNDATRGNRGQHVAREHDKIIIPIANSRVDELHKGLVSKNNVNLETIQRFAAAIASPLGPCFLNIGLLESGMELLGEITEGAPNIIVGDK